MQRFTKLSSTDKPLKASAKKFAAVRDERTGLIWSATSVKVKNHAEAEKTVAAMKAVGKQKWRLPTVEELFLLADRTRMSPAIDTDYFPDTASDWYWSSSPVAGLPGFAWGVFFYDGGSSWGYRSNYGFVRAVRGPVPAGQ